MVYVGVGGTGLKSGDLSKTLGATPLIHSIAFTGIKIEYFFKSDKNWHGTSIFKIGGLTLMKIEHFCGENFNFYQYLWIALTILSHFFQYRWYLG